MTSFHAFWALQEEGYAERQKAVSGKEATPLSVLDSWLFIRADVKTMYNDAMKVLKVKPAFATVLAKKTVVTKKEFKSINARSLDEHSSLAQILDYILKLGDSPALQHAISEHIEKHTKNVNAARYLIVLYACLMKDVPLLNYLVMQQKLPLHYTIDTAKGDPKVSICWDLKTEQSIAALAAHEFVQHGQPLDAFPQLFTMSSKKTQGIVSKLKDSHNKIAPIVNAENPSQDDIDVAFKDFAGQGAIAAIAYILPKASKRAISYAFIKAADARISRLLIDLVKDSDLLRQAIDASIGNVKTIELVLPFYLCYKKHAVEKDMLEKRKPGSNSAGELAEVSPAIAWINVAYDRNVLEVMQPLAPSTDRNTIKSLPSAAAKDGKSEAAHVLARYVTHDAISAAIEEANTGGHADLAKALFEEDARKKPAERVLLTAAKDGSLGDLEKWMSSVSADIICYALLIVPEKGKMDSSKACSSFYEHVNQSCTLCAVRWESKPSFCVEDSYQCF